MLCLFVDIWILSVSNITAVFLALCPLFPDLFGSACYYEWTESCAYEYTITAGEKRERDWQRRSKSERCKSINVSYGTYNHPHCSQANSVWSWEAVHLGESRSDRWEHLNSCLIIAKIIQSLHIYWLFVTHSKPDKMFFFFLNNNLAI